MKSFLKIITLSAIMMLTFAISASAQTTLVNSGFEPGDPTVWNFANVSATNQWFIGTATNNGGTQAAYISNDAGVTNTYGLTTTSTNHIYTSVNFPAGQTAIILSFDWRGVAEPSATGGSTFDYIRVSLTTSAPVAGSFTATTDQLPVIFTGQPGYVKGWVVIPASNAGTTKNLVFTWRNDSSLGNPTPGPAIDNVLLTSNTPTALTGTLSIPGTYASFGQAIANLNAHGVGAGGVTFNVAAGSTFNETPPAITVSGTVANQVIFQKSGVGVNPLITSTGTGNTGVVSTGSVGGGGDGVIVIQGGDYITFDGIDTASGNFTGTSSCIEAGYLVRNASATDGANNNTIRNTNITLNRNVSSATTPSVGIFQSTNSNQAGVVPTATSGTNANNKYYNFTIQNAYAGVWLNGTTNFPDDLTEVGVTGAVMQNTIGAATANDIGNGANATWGIRATAQSNVKIFKNEIRNVNGTSSGTVDGIFLDNSNSGTLSAGTNLIYGNKIHDIGNNTSTTAGVVYGIRDVLTNNAASISRVYNNFIWNLNSASTATSSRRIIGIGAQIGGTGTASTHNIQNNSVRLSPSNVAFSNAAFEIGTSTPIFVVQNNIFANFTGAQTGSAKHYCWVSTSASASGGAGSVSSFNDLYVDNTTNGFVGLGSTTDYATLANWQGRTDMPDTIGSISVNPLFASATDLHLTGTSPAINAGTTIAAITDDIDMEVRPNGGAYDIGADEFYPQPGVLQLSSASYGGNEGTMVTITVNRVSGSSGTVGVTATLMDGTAIGGATCGAGVDYVNPGPQMLSFGDTVTSQSFMVQLCTDAVLDPNETFTVTLSSPTGGATLGTPTMATVTITDVPPPFNGTYSVGTAGTYPSLTNNGGIFQAINTAGATGNITIEITSDLTGETGTHALNELAGGFTVLIKPSGAARTITSTPTATALIRLNGADNVTIDGSLSGGSDQSLTLSLANSTGNGTTVVFIASLGAGAGAMNNTIKNTIIENATNFSASTNANFGIFAGLNTGAANGPDNDNLTIQNNLIRRTSIGIQAYGAVGGLNDNLLIADNTIGGILAADFLGLQGANFGQSSGGVVTRNTVRNIVRTGSGSTSGILVGTGAVSSSVTRNSVSNLEANTSIDYGSTGIRINTGAGSSSITIANNFVFDIKGKGSTTSFFTDTNVGIRVEGTNTGGINIWNNSVNLFGDYAGFNGATISAALMINATTPSALDVRNNILVNISNNTTVTTDKNYSIYTNSNNVIFSSINNNDYFFAAGNPLGAINESSVVTDKANLSAWQTATGQDGASVSVDPLFVSSTDLHLQSTSTLLGAGAVIGSVTNDYDNDPRPAMNPDIGADEIVQSSGGSFPSGTFYNAILGTGDMLAGNATVTNSLTLTGISNTGGNTLTLGCNATVSGGGMNNYVIGSVAKQFCTTGMFTYPIGTTPDNMLTDNGIPMMPEYSPFTANVTAIGVVPSTLTVNVVDGTLAGSDPMQSVSRYWDVTETGDLTADISFTYLDQDITGMESGFSVLRRASGMTAVYMGGMIDAMTNTATAPGVTNFSQWGAGMLAPTAASGSISGQVLTANGQGIRNAVVMVTGGGLSEPRYVQTGSFGKYQIDELQLGQTYVVTVISKKYIFQNPSFVITLDSDLSNVNFEANER